MVEANLCKKKNKQGVKNMTVLFIACKCFLLLLRLWPMEVNKAEIKLKNISQTKGNAKLVEEK